MARRRVLVQLVEIISSYEPELTLETEVSEYKGLGVWMVNRNSTDVRKGAVLSDYIRVLSHHETDEERNEAMQFMNSTKDRQAVTFLSKDVLWDTVLEMIEHPFYSGITQSMVLDWRKLGVMTQPVSEKFPLLSS